MTSQSARKVPVLILLAAIAATTSWMSGCAGFAEPLPPLGVTPASLSVSAKVGSASSQTVTATNLGTNNIDISQTAVIGTGFSMTGMTPPLSLAPGQSKTFAVKFVATKAGGVDGTLSIMTDAKHRPVVLPLHGNATSATSTAPEVSSVTVSPASASAAPNGKVQFTATIQGTTTNDTVTWTASLGSITSLGVFTAPSSSGTGVVTATSVADPTKSASAVVTVTSTPAPPPTPSGPTVTSVTVSPSAASVAASGKLQFAAAVAGTASDKSVTWQASFGSITSSGAFTAPSSAGTGTVTATSNADSTKSASAAVTVTSASNPPPADPTVTSVTVSPSSASPTTGGVVHFTATVQGTASDKSVTWKANLGSITSAGVYTAPSSPGTDTVTATSDADPTKSDTSSVSINRPAQPGAVPAFPGAEGGGAASVGGRGGAVIEVTNLNNSGTGSFRACVEASGPRTCVFRVAGVIHPTGRIIASSPFLTIAGQTAPGGGITLQGDLMSGDSPTILFITAHDVVVRYLTCRIGLGAGHTSGPSTGASCWELASGTVTNVMLDHLSASWWDNKGYITACNDACGGIHDNTVQWSLDAEPNAAHPVGPMTDATIGGPADNGTNNDFHHNMYASIDHRIPLFNVKSGRWMNNLTWNAGSMGANFLGLWQGGSMPDIIGNKVVNGNLSSGSIHEYQFNSSQSGDSTTHDMPGPPAIFMRNNVTPHNSSVTGAVNDASQTVSTTQGSEGGGNSGPAVPSSWFRAIPLAAQPFPITEDSPNDLDSVLLATVGNSQGVDCSGNWVNRRDSVDTRLISEYKNRSNGGFFHVVDSTHSVPTIAAGTACAEDIDHLPIAYKQAKGLPVGTNVANQVAANRYTNLENWLNGQ